MRICPNCKATIEDNKGICESCGVRVPSDPGVVGKVRCPQCGETHALDSNMVTVGSLSRMYWICRSCKKRFRDADDLEKELNTTNPKSRAIRAIIDGVGFLIIFLFISGYLSDVYSGLDYWKKQSYEILQTLSVVFLIAGIGMFALLSFLGIKQYQNWKLLLQEKEELK